MSSPKMTRVFCFFVPPGCACAAPLPSTRMPSPKGAAADDAFLYRSRRKNNWSSRPRILSLFKESAFRLCAPSSTVFSVALATKAAFNLHRPRPPQPPAPSFKSPDRNVPAISAAASSRQSLAATFPIKATDFSLMWFPRTAFHDRSSARAHFPHAASCRAEADSGSTTRSTDVLRSEGFPLNAVDSPNKKDDRKRLPLGRQTLSRASHPVIVLGLQ